MNCLELLFEKLGNQVFAELKKQRLPGQRLRKFTDAEEARNFLPVKKFRCWEGRCATGIKQEDENESNYYEGL